MVIYANPRHRQAVPPGGATPSPLRTSPAVGVRQRLCSPDRVTLPEKRRWATPPLFEGSVASPLPSRDAECAVAPYTPQPALRLAGDRKAHVLTLAHPDQRWGLFCCDAHDGVRVHSVAEASPAAEAGLLPGAQIVTVQDLAVRQAADIAQLRAHSRHARATTVVVVTGLGTPAVEDVVGVQFPTPVPSPPVIRHARDGRAPVVAALAAKRAGDADGASGGGGIASPPRGAHATPPPQPPLQYARQGGPLPTPPRAAGAAAAATTPRAARDPDSAGGGATAPAAAREPVQFRALCDGLPPPPGRSVRGLFRRLGVVGSDTLTFEQFENAMTCEAVQGEVGWPREHAAKLFGYLDEDGSGEVDVDEMQRFLEAQKLFYRIDEDHTGFIDKFELREALMDRDLERKLGVRWADAHTAFNAIDDDSSGEISFPEFLEYFASRLLRGEDRSDTSSVPLAATPSLAPTASRMSSSRRHSQPSVTQSLTDVMF